MLALYAVSMTSNTIELNVLQQKVQQSGRQRALPRRRTSDRQQHRHCASGTVVFGASEVRRQMDVQQLFQLIDYSFHLSSLDGLKSCQVEIVKVRRLHAASHLPVANLVLFRVKDHETTARLPLPGLRSGYPGTICSCISGRCLELLSESQSLTCFLCSLSTISRADADRKRRNTIPTNSFFVARTRKHEHYFLISSSRDLANTRRTMLISYLCSSSLSRRYFI